jgi:hypothetical protein
LAAALAALEAEDEGEVGGELDEEETGAEEWDA